MVGTSPSTSLAHRSGLALSEALRHHRRRGERMVAEGRIRHLADVLIDGLEDDQLPGSLDRSRLRSPDSAAALAVNTFLPWQATPRALPLAGWIGFEAIQFEVRCPTGLRGTPPHLDLLAVREEAAVAITVRCSEYLSRKKSAVAPSYDRLLASTPGAEAWAEELARLRKSPTRYRFVDFGALVKFALALGRTFPDRPATLLYLYWQPVDAHLFEEFRTHGDEARALANEIRGSRISLLAQPLEDLMAAWMKAPQPPWLGQHLARLRERYTITLGTR